MRAITLFLAKMLAKVMSTLAAMPVCGTAAVVVAAAAVAVVAAGQGTSAGIFVLHACATILIRRHASQGTRTHDKDMLWPRRVVLPGDL